MRTAHTYLLAVKALKSSELNENGVGDCRATQPLPELPPEQLETHEEFTTLEQRTDRLQSRAERLLPEADKLISEFTGIDREGY
jgi:hypothetical protein